MLTRFAFLKGAWSLDGASLLRIPGVSEVHLAGGDDGRAVVVLRGPSKEFLDTAEGSLPACGKKEILDASVSRCSLNIDFLP